MSNFDVAELRRLSEAAIAYAGDEEQAVVEARAAGEQCRAYLGTHRDRIIAMLDAADALAEAVHSCEGLAVVGGNGAEAQGRAIRSTCEAYLAAKGGV